MQCEECQQAVTDPTIDGDVAYWVCHACGHCEIRPAREPTATERIAQFQSEYAVVLPLRYIELVEANTLTDFHDSVIPNPGPTGQEIDRYVGARPFIEIDNLFGVSEDESQSIFCSENMTKEWELPNDLVLLAGDGHTWLALDYRGQKTEPPVILIESHQYSSVQLARTFETLLDALRPHDDIYDQDGELRP